MHAGSVDSSRGPRPRERPCEPHFRQEEARGGGEDRTQTGLKLDAGGGGECERREESTASLGLICTFVTIG